MTARLPKRERREPVAINAFSHFSQQILGSSGLQTPEFKSPESSPTSRRTPGMSFDSNATEYESPTMSPRLEVRTPKPSPSSVFGIERKTPELRAPHVSRDNREMSLDPSSGSSAELQSFPRSPRPVGAAVSDLLHHPRPHHHQHSAMYSLPPASGSQYSNDKFNYPGGYVQPQSHYHSGHVTHRRPSVIMRAGREDSNKLQLQADILKFHGNILTHTGNS